MTNVNILHGDCREQLKTLPDNSVDSIVTDPPYELGFMGKSWDASGIAYNVDMWQEALRVLKPGGHMLAFSGSRTYHRMTVAIEDAGFEIRDQIMWVYGQGFPKSHNVGKAIDATLLTGSSHSKNIKSVNELRPGEFRETATLPNNGVMSEERRGGTTNDNPATSEAEQWNGWGSALKPAHEPICVARKPLEGTIAQNVLKHGTGALNIDASRVGGDLPKPMTGTGWAAQDKKNAEQRFRPNAYYADQDGVEYEPNQLDRWPANFIHDGSEEVVKLFPNSKGGSGNGNAVWGESGDITPLRRGTLISRNDDGSAARFFYCAKASPQDRNDGLEHFEGGKTNDGRKKDANNAYQRGATIRKNTHPTVKPTDLMIYLCRMVTPFGGTVLDPFMGSGSTGRGAINGGFNFIGIEMNQEYIDIARARIAIVEKRKEAKINTVFNNLFEEE